MMNGVQIFFKDVFQQMLQSCKALAPGSQFKLPGVNSLILMDATTIQLCLDVFPWATYTQSKGAIMTEPIVNPQLALF